MLLVTGASGYIGRALLAGLRSGGFSVCTAGRQVVCEAVEHRFLDFEQRAIDPQLLAGVDRVIHCGGIAHNRGAEVDYRRINVDGTLALAERARESGCRQFVFFSTLNCVPATASSAAFSALELTRPEGVYAASKWLAERALIKLFAGTDCELILLRPALVYDTELVANLALLKRLLRNIPVALPDTGRRLLVSRPDLVALTLRLVSEPLQAGENTGRVVVAADGECYTARRIGRALASGRQQPIPESLWRIICRCWDLGRRLPVGTTWSAIGDSHWCGSVASTAGWQPRFTLEALQAVEPS